jgi:cell division protein FtsZ
MDSNSPTRLEGSPSLRIFGAGDAALSVIELLIADGLSPELFVALNAGGPALEKSTATRKILLENKRLRGLGSGGDPERGRQAAEEKNDQIKSLCENIDVVFVLAGLGGGSGTGISPVVARVAKAAGALVLAFVTTPFECEGNRRQFLAGQGFDELKDAADGVVCLPNQKIFKLIEENTSLVDTLRISNRLLADGVKGFWRLLAFQGLIQIEPGDLIRLLQGHHSECAFAVAQADGPERARQAFEKLMAHPMLDGGQVLADSSAVMISLTGGPSLTMAEVNHVMENIKALCQSAEILMGAVVDEHFADRLALTVITSKEAVLAPVARGQSDSLDAQLLDRTPGARPNSRFLPPPPALPPDQVQQILARQKSRRSASHRTSMKMRQAQLPLEIVSKGRFDKSEPTIHKGEDLDVPTYIRRGVPLN